MHQWVMATERENKFLTEISEPIYFNGGAGETTDVGRCLRLKFAGEIFFKFMLKKKNQFF
jgi:hypothetical protein